MRTKRKFTFALIRESTTANEEELTVMSKEHGIHILLTRHDCARSKICAF